VTVPVLALLLFQAAASTAVPTLRVDYVHAGMAGKEVYALDGLVLEGPWPGHPARALDETGLGRYRFEVKDAASGKLLYSRGFASVYGEWETTSEASERSRAFHESLRFPLPAAKAKVVIRTRAADNSFTDSWTLDIDPADPAIDRSAPPAAARVWAVEKNGEPRDKVDLLLMGDGYTAAEMEKWHADARRLAGILFARSPFKERRKDFNVWALDIPSDESGVARPSDGVFRKSALRAAYDAFGSERYVLALDNKRLREAASAAPYEFIEIVVNDRKYGGGGIHNLYATVSADNKFTPYVFVHEFGHHFAGLADEYYTSAVAYESPQGRPEPWETNATADPQGSKWKDLITPGTPLPTTWEKETFEAAQRELQARRRQIRADKRPETEMEALFEEERLKTTELLARGPHGRAVGAFEGAMYQAQGYYRPQADCTMFTRDEVGFCAVCKRTIDRVIDQYTPPRP
jgi:hypothetical protein